MAQDIFLFPIYYVMDSKWVVLNPNPDAEQTRESVPQDLG